MRAVTLRPGTVLFLPLAALAISCSDIPDPVQPEMSAAAAFAVSHAAPPPAAALRTVSFGGSSVTFWPYTGTDFSLVPSDPINVLFTGDVDPRQLRAALLMLPDGDRTAFGFPDAFPFNCTWADQIDPDPQTSYADGPGWIGSAVQLTCGDVETLRFHVRFFAAGGWTLANAHFEVRIPGTPEHQVLSWEIAEALLAVDFIRSGLVNPATDVGLSGIINEAPTFRTILAAIYNGIAPLWPILGTPGPVNADVPIPNDGRATILRVPAAPNASPMLLRRDYVIQFDQVISKPFCVTGAPSDLLYVNGPIHIDQLLRITPSGNYISQFHARGQLTLLPVAIDPQVGIVPVGEPYTARVLQHNKAIATDNVTLISRFLLQIELPPSLAGRGSLTIMVHLGPGNGDFSDASIRCGG